MNESYGEFLPKEIPQTEPLNEDQVENNAGGFVYSVGDINRIKRFIILGSDSNTYYSSARNLSLDNLATIIPFITSNVQNACAVINMITTISTTGAAPRQTHGIYLLALCASVGIHRSLPMDKQDATQVRLYALSKVNTVCRTASTLLLFISYLKKLRCIGSRSVSRAIGNWYKAKVMEAKNPTEGAKALSYQLVKYKNRSSFSHKDVLKLTRISPKDNAVLEDLFAWIVKGVEPQFSVGDPYSIIKGDRLINHAKNGKEGALLISTYGLPHECVPTHLRKDPDVWKALVVDMPLMATLRNLRHLNNYGVLQDKASRYIITHRFTNEEVIKHSRIHPIHFLLALVPYCKSRNENNWSSFSDDIVEALMDGFAKSFKVRPAFNGVNIDIGLDVSGSMDYSFVGNSGLTAREVSVAMSSIFLKTNTSVQMNAFAHNYQPIPITDKTDMLRLLSITNNMDFGGTDCSLPIKAALKNKNRIVDVFIVYTDNETWIGKEHPSVVFDKYISSVNPHAKMIICATTSNGFSIIGNHPAGLDVVGFDPSVPEIVDQFISGNNF